MAEIEEYTTRRGGSRSRGRIIRKKAVASQRKRRKRETYKVKTGDNWYSIAKKKNRKARQLARANRKVQTLRPGQVITIPDDYDVPLHERVRAPRPPQPEEIRKAGDRYRYDPASVQAGRQTAQAYGIDWGEVQNAVNAGYDVQRVQGQTGQVPATPYFPETVPTEIGLKFGRTTLPAEIFPGMQPGAPPNPLPGLIPETNFAGLRGAGTYARERIGAAVRGAGQGIAEAIANRPTGMESLPPSFRPDEYNPYNLPPNFPRAPASIRLAMGARPQGEVPYSPDYITAQERVNASPTAIAGVPAGEIDPERALRTSPSMRMTVLTTMIDNGHVPTRLTADEATALGMTEADLIDAGYTFDGEYWVRSAYSNTPPPTDRGEYSGYGGGGYGYGYGGGGGGGGGGGSPQTGRYVSGRPGGSQSPLPPGVFGLVSWSGI